jgi:23S rRNA (cytosine1962-C5)-methyltransferase
MQLETFKKFKDFQLLDTGDGFRLERWGKFILQRPDPQIIWERHLPDSEWEKCDAKFINGDWKIISKIPKSWQVEWEDISLVAKLSPFKHTGIFAEQAANWEWMRNKIGKNGKGLKILNLFAYTGGASIALAKAGCFVTHVDASKPSIAWAKENHGANKLPQDSVRWILDDAAKFVARELKRGSVYDGIIMDPPAFGHGPTGNTWKFNENLPPLLKDAVQLLSPNAKFLVINGYATNSSALALKNTLEDATKGLKGKIEFGELCLEQSDKRLISTGIFARWSR